jgi:hypothetical protein
MMKALIFLTALIMAGAAHAHTGHIADVAGHNHWLAGVAIGAAAGIALWQTLKGKRKSDEADAEAEVDASTTDDKPQEA